MSKIEFTDTMNFVETSQPNIVAKYIDDKDQQIAELKKQLEITEQLRQEALSEGLKVVERDSNIIGDLQKQLEEKDKEIEEFKRIGEKGHLNDLLEDQRKTNRILIKVSEKLLQRLKSQPREIVEKIKSKMNDVVDTLINLGNGKEDAVAWFCGILEEILKEYGGEK